MSWMFWLYSNKLGDVSLKKLKVIPKLIAVEKMGSGYTPQRFSGDQYMLQGGNCGIWCGPYIVRSE